MGVKVFVATAFVLALSGQAAYAPKPAPDTERGLHSADVLRESLLSEADIPSSLPSNYVLATFDGGLPPGRARTVVARQSDHGEWVVDDVNRPVNWADLNKIGPKSIYLPAVASRRILDAKSSEKVEALLHGQSLYTQNPDMTLVCLDAVFVAIRVRYDGRTFNALRDSCQKDEAISLVQLLASVTP